MTSTVVFSEHCDRAPGQITTCDAAAATYVHGIVGDTADFLPDGLGGMLARWRRVTSVSGDPNAPHTLSFASEPRLSRVVGGAVDFDMVVSENEHTAMIGGGGTAYVSSPTAWHAMDVATWTPIWSNSNLDLEPVIALGNGGVAMHDLDTGILHELDASGGTIRSAPFGSRWGSQSTFGHWTSVNSGQVSSRVSLPVNETPGSFTLMGELGTAQQAPKYRKFKTMDLAALSALDYTYDLTRLTRWEFGGVICGIPGAFWWSSIVTNEQPGWVITIDSPGLTPEQRAHLPACPATAAPQPVATFHTHVFNGGEPYPSGWVAGSTTPNDLTNAVARPDLVFFIRTPNKALNPTGVFSLRYQAIQEEGGWSARNNIFKWNGTTWVSYSPQ